MTLRTTSSSLSPAFAVSTAMSAPIINSASVHTESRPPIRLHECRKVFLWRKLQRNSRSATPWLWRKDHEGFERNVENTSHCSNREHLWIAVRDHEPEYEFQPREPGLRPCHSNECPGPHRGWAE